MNKQERQSKLLNLIPKAAKKIGEHSVNATCVWWMRQPNVPTAMLKKDESKNI